MSTALTLVNRVLRGTGDYSPNLTTITGAPGDIGDRILDFLNSTIAEVELLTNWPTLRQDVTATTDGTNAIYTYNGSSDIRVEGPVSVWLAGKWALEEITPEQFDNIKAVEGTTGSPIYFQRRSGTGNQLSVEILGTPASGETLTITAYRRATRLVNNTDTTDFDDDVLVQGAMMRMDAYDGLDRGYAALYKKMRDDLVTNKFRNIDYRITVESYA